MPAVARAHGYTTLVLGAWGCGAFGEVVFAITDWSPERRFLVRFRDVLQRALISDGPS